MSAPEPDGSAPPAPSRAQRFLLALDRAVLGIFFRRVEVEGVERVPAGRPLVIVANHTNGLVDAMLVFGCLPVQPRFLGKSTLWDIAPLRPFLEAARVIPVYRRHDAGVDASRNVETFAASREALAAGDSLAIFPEGKSHSEPALAPLKTGAARIALEAEAAAAEAASTRGATGRPLGVAILPVGLVFDRKEQFRSRALVEIGEPIEPLEGIAHPAAAAADPEVVRALTERIDAALQAVTVNYASWEEGRLVARAAEIYARAPTEVPQGAPLAASSAVRRAFAAGYREMAERHPERLAEVAAAVREYDRLLAAAGISDRHVASRYPAPPVLRFLRRTLATLAVRLPLAAVGVVLNVVPYQVVSLIARRIASPDQSATWKVFPALAAYPLTWLAEAVAAGWLVARLEIGGPGTGGAPWLAALAVLVLAPLSGRVALGFHDRGSRLAREARAFLLLGTRRRFAERLRTQREEIRRQVAELVELYQDAARQTPEVSANP